MTGLAIILALASSVAWGVADFAGGMASRRLPTISVTVVSQCAGFVALLVFLAVRTGGLDRRSLAIGLASGVGGGIGLAAFYKALSLGTMSIVSPITACGAVIPFGLSVLTGERPALFAVAGAAIALTGATMASAEERRAPASDRGRAVTMAVVAAVALGLFTYFLGLGSREGDAFSALFGARIGSLVILTGLALVVRRPLSVPRKLLLAVVAIGLCDVGANALFAVASTHGLLALVAVLGSLYPVATVILAHTVLHERLTRVQIAGVVTALVGVAILASA